MTFVNYPGHFIAGLLLIMFGVAVFFAFRSGQLKKAKLKRYRLPLAAMQYMAILVLLFILWNPSRPKVTEVVTKNSVLAFFDTSESMSVVEDGRTSRLDKAIEIFKEKFHPEDSAVPNYEIFGFDGRSYESGSLDFLRRWGPRTDMRSILTTLSKYDIDRESGLVENAQADGLGEDRSAGKNKVTGAVIFTDGQADDRNIESYPRVRGENFQVLVVGVGSRRPQPDIDVKSITAPARAAIATAYKAEVVVSVKNLQNKEVEIELLKDGDVVDSRQISADSFVTKGQGQSRSKTIEFTLGAERLGSYVLSARAKVSEKAGEGALAGEVNTANNIRSTMVEVVEEARLKVLFYCQRANFNIGKIRQALARDKKIELDLALDVVKSPVLSAEALKSSSYVKLPEGRDGFNTYDIIILGACEPDSLSRTQIDSLYSFSADRGGGLIVLPGRDEFGPDAWVDRKTKSLVPAIFKPEEVTFDRFEPGKMKLTLEGIDSKFISPEVLEEFDEPTSAYYRTVVTKPAATTLALAEDTPVISVHRVGRGRICLLNVSKLFLLYREDLQGGLLYELMAGLTAYVGRVRNREAGVRMFAERSNDQTDKVKFSAYVCDKSFEPVTGANVLLTVSQDVLIMNELGDGYYTAEIKDTEGLTITATAQAEVDGIFLGEKTIAVNLPPVRGEMTNVEFDESFLKNLSQKLNARYYYADDIGEDIAKTFKARTSSSGSPRMTSIWPNWLVLLVLCTLLSINWYLRRAVGLV